jgi:hypothetical protein
MLESRGRSVGCSLMSRGSPIPGEEALLESFTGLNGPQSAVRGVVSVGVHNRSSLLEMSGVFNILGVLRESISRGDRSAAILFSGNLCLGEISERCATASRASWAPTSCRLPCFPISSLKHDKRIQTSPIRDKLA